ncbi:MAG: Bug family tripartite tricarboxylate transporter substrate binding protein [Beijerinckiaceae bacterium]
MIKRALLAAGFGLAAVSLTGAARAQSVAEFYKGNTIRIVIWAAAGGEYDIHGKIVSRHIGRHIPGNPAVVATQMTGGGGLVAANHVYNVAPKDGTTMGMMVSSLPFLQAIGLDGVKFDASKFNWVGTLAPTQEGLVAWHTAPVKKFEDLLTTEFVLGASGAGSTSVLTPTMINALLGAKIKIVPGYPGGSQINLAMERGESMGRWNTWSSWKTTHPDWIAQKKIVFLLTSALRKPKDLQEPPLLTELARNEDDRRIFELLATNAEMGRPIAATPGVPADRMAAILAAYRAMLKDPEFLADAAKLKIEIDPIIGDDLKAMAEKALSTPKHLTERVKKLM